jgi:hypothetical protein
MRNLRSRVSLLALLLLGAWLSIPARADAVAVSLGLIGENGSSKTLTLAELAAMPQADEGPLRVAVAGEEHHAGWIRQLTRLVHIAPPEK